MFASISDAWGTGSLETRSLPPGYQTSPAVTRNAPFNAWTDGTVPAATLSDSQRFQQVKFYVNQLVKQKGIRGVAKLLGARTCRKIRNMYLLKPSPDDLLHVLLFALVATLVYRLVG